MYLLTPIESIVAHVATMLDRLPYSRRPDLKSVEIGHWKSNKKWTDHKWVVLLTVPNHVFTAALRENKRRKAIT